jgi:hypothetical protein
MAPINPAPDPEGTIVLNDDGTYSVIPVDRLHIVRLYRTSHMTTCPARIGYNE